MAEYKRPEGIAINDFGFALSSVNEAAFGGLEGNGEYGTDSYEQIAVWDDDVADFPTVEEMQQAALVGNWRRIRKQRAKLLAETDWMANSDVTMSEEMTAYRQALRDLPQTYTEPTDVVWPTNPHVEPEVDIFHPYNTV